MQVDYPQSGLNQRRKNGDTHAAVKINDNGDWLAPGTLLSTGSAEQIRELVRREVLDGEQVLSERIERLEGTK